MRSRSVAADRRVLTSGVIASVVLLALGVFVPWRGTHFPEILAWLWIPVAVGVVLSFLPSRFFWLWFGLGLVAVVAALGWAVPTRLAPVVIVFVAGAEIGLTVRGVFTNGRVGEAGRRSGVRLGERTGSAMETVIVGTYPRDDVRWPDDGVVREGTVDVRFTADGAPAVESLRMGGFAPIAPQIPVGDRFDVHVSARCGGDRYERGFRLRSTGDEDDVQRCTVGPGLRVERGRWGRKHVSGFEFGVTVMGAVLEPVHVRRIGPES